MKINVTRRPDFLFEIYCILDKAAAIISNVLPETLRLIYGKDYIVLYVAEMEINE